MTEHPILNGLIFSSAGIVLFVIAAAILLRLTPLKLWREIGEQHNIAAAIFLGAVAISLALIIAAAFH
jgi:putative membrane protein